MKKKQYFEVRIDLEGDASIEEKYKKRISYGYVMYYLRFKRWLDKEAYVKMFVSVDHNKRKMCLHYIYSTKQATLSLGQKCFQEVTKLAIKYNVDSVETLVFNKRIQKIMLRYHFKPIFRSWYGDERFAFFLT